MHNTFSITTELWELIGRPKTKINRSKYTTIQDSRSTEAPSLNKPKPPTSVITQPNRIPKLRMYAVKLKS